jgi:hypothetical protein
MQRAAVVNGEMFIDTEEVKTVRTGAAASKCRLIRCPFLLDHVTLHQDPDKHQESPVIICEQYGLVSKHPCALTVIP